ncbi:hypothetical protein [Chryseobacterium gleum]|uniref:hypothetical protein n=1 Tax=Chryseobacterium gleum TaxID=250 RepID=UPI00241D6421|nr:hypothetical protein [Chryseobacterium gleum]
MPGLQIKKRVNYFNNDEQKAKFILETTDRLLPFFLEHDSFAIHELYKNLEKNIPERRKYHTITHHIESYLVDKNLIEKVPQNLHYKLTKEGRDAKRIQSLKKYKKSLQPKWTSHQIVTAVISGISIIIAAMVAILNYRERDNSKKQMEQFQNEIKVLNERLKKIEKR